MRQKQSIVLIRGGGDLATGVAVRLRRCGIPVFVTEIPKPLAVRRLVALAEAVYCGEVTVEEVRGLRVDDPYAVLDRLAPDVVPVLIDPEAESRHVLKPIAIVDGRMRKMPSELLLDAAPFTIGLGPGFEVGRDCHAIIETHRGHTMGRVYWQGSALLDTTVPEAVHQHDVDRVLRASAEGKFQGLVPLASIVEQSDRIAQVGEVPLKAPFRGVVRGLLHSGLEVEKGMKVGDLDPRTDPEHCSLISDKSLAVGGGVLEALLSHHDIRKKLGL